MPPPRSKKILYGQQEVIFDFLPQNVLANFYHPRSENALLWNIIYSRSQPDLDWRRLVALPPLWGTAVDAGREPDDRLIPYYWGYRVSGEKLEGLDDVLTDVDGPGPKTEVDLFLKGRSKLVVVEAKHTAALGKCSRYQAGRCPEIHRCDDRDEPVCRYWEAGPSMMDTALAMGERPVPGDGSPPCNEHYQLARTLMVGLALERKLKLELHLWLILPRRSWKRFQPTWLDFAERVRDEERWRRMRVLAWEELESYEI
jgi:hypothetical protein